MQPVDEVKTIMIAYLVKNRSDRVVTTNLSEGLQLRTQAPIQSNPYGKKKFETGLETVTFSQIMPGRPITALARLSEISVGEYEFEDIALSDHHEVVIRHLALLHKLAT